jgi:RimJ/RimL family protein N-acetyltransferase
MLIGEKVSLRAPTEGDLDALYEIAAELGSWEERNTTPARPLPRPEFAEEFKKGLTTPDGDVRFVIVSGGSAVVGRCALFAIDQVARNGEVGIALHASARARGHGTDALRVLVRFGFDRRNLHRLHLSTLASNEAALACYRKVGFVEEGRRRESAWVRGEYQDEILMSLLRSEWLA